MSNLRKNILEIYASVLSIGGLYYIFIRITGWGIPCAFNKITGLLCPGCGITRMFLSLAKFDIPRAFMYNPAAFILLIYWNTVAVMCFIDKIKFVKSRIFLYTSLFASIALLFVSCIVRNII